MERNLMCGTRGASYTNFPRNTKEQHLRSCAQAVRDAERIEADVEAAYAEYQPGQVFHSEAMREADDINYFLGVRDELYPDVRMRGCVLLHDDGTLLGLTEDVAA